MCYMNFDSTLHFRRVDLRVRPSGVLVPAPVFLADKDERSGDLDVVELFAGIAASGT